MGESLYQTIKYTFCILACFAIIGVIYLIGLIKLGLEKLKILS